MEMIIGGLLMMAGGGALVVASAAVTRPIDLTRFEPELSTAFPVADTMPEDLATLLARID